MATVIRNEKWYEEGRGPRTPWGPTQCKVSYAEGLAFYETASHGGFHLSPSAEAYLDQVMRELGTSAEEARMGYSAGWYEEDCSALAVMVAFPDLFPDSDPDDRLQSLLYWIGGH